MKNLNKYLICSIFLVLGVIYFFCSDFKEITVYEFTAEEKDNPIKIQCADLYCKNLNEWFDENYSLKVSINLKDDTLFLSVHPILFFAKGERYWEIVSRFSQDSLFAIDDLFYEDGGFLRNLKIYDREENMDDYKKRVEFSVNDFKDMMEILFETEN